MVSLPSFADHETFRTWRADTSQWLLVGLIQRDGGRPTKRPPNSSAYLLGKTCALYAIPAPKEIALVSGAPAIMDVISMR
jgi:hypothetical protein